MSTQLDDNAAMNYCQRKQKNKDFNTGPWIPSKEAGHNKIPPNCNNVRLDLSAYMQTQSIFTVGRNLDVKLPRSLIVNPARNNVNLDVVVNLDVDVVKYQYYI